MKDLLLEIAFCENFINNNKADNPCKKIVNSQHDGKKHLPEPWSGHIDSMSVKILFIGSNPSISHKEKFPELDWERGEIIDFFTNRFSKNAKWMKDSKYPLLENGSYPTKKRGSNFWSGIKSTARVLLDLEPDPGIHYAFTEIVRCKSTQEYGVIECAPECAKRYLHKTIQICQANLIICLGKNVKTQFQSVYSVPASDTDIIIENLRIGPIDRTIIFMPHPTSREVRRIDRILTPEKLSQIKLLLT